MRHHVFSAAIGLALAAALLPASATSVQAGDPSGYWRKANQGQFPAKMQLYRCSGRGICVKIVWLKNPRDSKGRALQDVRNVNASLRKRTIEGMHIIRGMKQVSANQWKGTVYNPEDGKTYSATVTLASSRKIVLKGCVASFLCREQVWLRTSAPPPREEEKKPETQVEASAQPGVTPVAASAGAAAAGSSVANAEVLAPAAQQNLQPGYRYLNGSKTNQHPESFAGESVSSMFSMATPLAPGSAQAAAGAGPAPAHAATTDLTPPAPQQASVQPEAAALAAEPMAPAAAPAAPAAAPAAPAAAPTPDVEAAPSEAVPEPQVAEQSDAAQGQRRTWRERRQMRRQKRLKELQAQGQNLIPWLR
ncbi:MAG: DUF2147 domain-containing protein [Methyloceanibacter sp.]|uniref:DUF2147 domain-containing protein n=1 Tax=Methyloceanibacter sp. TaxID=1965321 RepID=UPI003C622E7A